MRKEQGSITMIVFATVTFILIVLATTMTSMTYKRKSQAVELQDLKNIYSMGNEENIEAQWRKTAIKSNILPGYRLSGSGTLENPYKINKIEDLVRLSNRVNAGDNLRGKYVKLMNNLDFNVDSSYENPNGAEFGDINGNGIIEALKIEMTTGRGFTPIGNYNENPIPFSGTFDGDKKTIDHLYMYVTDLEGEFDVGLFGFSNGTIKDLYVTNVDLTDGCEMSIVGAVAANAVGTVQRCYSTGNITVDGDVMNVFVGGLVGLTGDVNGQALIDNCYTDIDISVTNSSNYGTFVGGIIGEVIMKNQIVSNCHSNARISINAANSNSTFGAGIVGLLGHQYYGNDGTTKVQKCYSRCTIDININGTSTTYTGTSIGIAIANSVVENVFAVDDSKTSSPILAAGSDDLTTNITNLETVSTSELISSDIMQKLGSEFVLNNGYPLLTWE